MIELAASEVGISVLPDELDADPFLLTVENGTLDLRSGQRCPHRREDLITKLAPVAYDPAAAAVQSVEALADTILERTGPLSKAQA